MFKASNGNLLTRSLFYEIQHDYEFSLYTLKDQDFTLSNGKVLIALKPKYLEIADVTEFRFATTFFNDWGHWLQISNTSWLEPYIAEWREALRAKMLSESYTKLTELSQGTGPIALGAAKYLHNWASKTRVGRPNKSKSPGQIAHEEHSFHKQIEQDFANIKGLN